MSRWFVASGPHAGIRLAPLDGSPHFVSPLRPGAVVVSHLLVAEQIMKNEPCVAGALADAAIGDDIIGRLHSTLVRINSLQFSRGLERAVLLDRGFSRNALCSGNVTSLLHAFLQVLRH